MLAEKKGVRGKAEKIQAKNIKFGHHIEKKNYGRRESERDLLFPGEGEHQGRGEEKTVTVLGWIVGLR